MGSILTAVASPVIGGLVSDIFAPSSGSVAGPGTVGGAAASAADPFAAQRPQYQQQLNAMMAPGAQFSSSDPSYAWRFSQGLQGVQRAQAAGGGAGSGAELAAITNYGQNLASTEYANQFSRLSQLAGANVGSPAAAGQIIQGAASQQQAGATAFGTQIASAVTPSLTSAFNNWINPQPVNYGAAPGSVDTGMSSQLPATGVQSAPWWGA